MRFVTSWIREFVDIPATDPQLAADYSMAGMAIESQGLAENGEPVFEADITTNRPDQMNHYGAAREAAVIYDRPLKPCCAKVVENGPAASGSAAIEIEDPELCARYSARVIRGVKVGPSPAWMVRRIEAAGARSINNVTDITNYLLLELGHPMHAFDLNLLAGGRIVVRRARPGETMATLDGLAREFNSGNLVIADAERPVAIAGVMGGLETGISERTLNVLIESAWFEPRSIRKTARQFGLHTDASHRFERGADLEVTALAADRAAGLICEIAGGEVCRGLIDVFPAPRKRPTLILHESELERILGARVPPADVERILRGLGFRVAVGQASTAADAARQEGEERAPHSAAGGLAWMLVPPSWRLDIEREIDVIEEVARLYGYNRFPNRLPAWAGVAHRAPNHETEARIRSTARALGYSESISFSLIAPREDAQFSACEPVKLANPLSEEASVLRTSMVPGILGAIERNLNRGVLAARLFEIGKTYTERGNQAGGSNAAGGRYEEAEVLALAASGDVAEPSVHAPQRPVGFFDLKGDVEAILDLFTHRTLYFDANVGVDCYHPGRAARAAMDGETVARFGEIHPEIAAARKLRQPVLVAELYLGRLYRCGLRQPRYEPLPRVPAVDRDFSLLVPEEVPFERLAEAVRRTGIDEIVAVQPIEIFRGEKGAGPLAGPGAGQGEGPGQVPAGKYSLLLRVVFQHPERTLSDAEVNEWSRAITARLEKELGVILRS